MKSSCFKSESAPCIKLLSLKERVDSESLKRVVFKTNPKPVSSLRQHAFSIVPTCFKYLSLTCVFASFLLNRCRFWSDIWRRTWNFLHFIHGGGPVVTVRPSVQPSGGGNFPGRGEDRSGDALGVVVLRCCWNRETLVILYSTLVFKHLSKGPYSFTLLPHTLYPLWLFFKADGWIKHPPVGCIYHAYPFPLNSRSQLDFRQFHSPLMHSISMCSCVHDRFCFA